MIWLKVLRALKHTTAVNHRTPIVFLHKTIELDLLGSQVSARAIPWVNAWKALDESMPFDIPRPIHREEAITVENLCKLVVLRVPEEDRNSVLVRLSGKLAELGVGPWEVLDHIAEGHFVEKESKNYK
jgi:hypothetical protein